MTEKTFGVKWLMGLAVISLIIGSVATQAYLMHGTTFVQRLEIRAQYDKCISEVDAQRQHCSIEVRRRLIRNR